MSGDTAAIPAPEVLTYPDQDALVGAAASRFIDVVTAAQERSGVAYVALTGGGAGIALLESLRADSGAIDWSRVEIFWGDDRFVPADDAERNELQAQRALLDHVDVDPARVHPMGTSDGEFADNPEQAAAAYATVLADHAPRGESVPRFDIHLLGMGGEGHVNSIFPDSPAVLEQERSVLAVHNCPKAPPTRVTLTLPAVRASRQVWLLVAGKAKSTAVAAALSGASPVEVPSAGAVGTDATLWFVDEGAASRLSR